jgi:hypothetical protein
VQTITKSECIAYPSAVIHDIFTPRQKLVDDIISRVGVYKLISVRGTPACGKSSLMHLLANELFTLYGQSPPTYTLTGWEPKKVQEAGGWAHYLEQTTGVNGDDWLNHNAYLLIDEAQQSYWDVNGLWDFFKSITLLHPVKVVSSPVHSTVGACISRSPLHGYLLILILGIVRSP